MILGDNNEPEALIELMQQSVPVVVTPLNQMHMSDYFFGNYEGKKLQFSRKQAIELLGNIDEAEDQLRDYYQQADENYQIVEGLISPIPLAMPTDKQLYAIKGGKLGWGGRYTPTTRPITEFSPTEPPPPTHYQSYGYRTEPLSDITRTVRYAITRGHTFNTPLSLVYAWIHRLAEAGIVTYWTLNWQETARLLVTIYRNDQKPPEEHSTLQRVIRPRITVKEAEPFMKALLYLSAAYKLGIGEKKVAALCDKFVNILDLAMASEDEIADCEGIGKTIARKILAALGRTL